MMDEVSHCTSNGSYVQITLVKTDEEVSANRTPSLCNTQSHHLPLLSILVTVNLTPNSPNPTSKKPAQAPAQQA